MMNSPEMTASARITAKTFMIIRKKTPAMIRKDK